MSATRKTPEIAKMESTSIRQLVDRVGKQEAARLMGVDQNNFARWLADGEARTAYVLAARHCLSQIDKRDSGTLVAVTVVTSDKRPAFDSFVKAIGLCVHYVTK